MKKYQKPSIEKISAQIQHIICASNSNSEVKKQAKHVAQHIIHHVLYG